MTVKTRTLHTLRDALRRSKTGTTLYHVLCDYREGRRHARGDLETGSGATHTGRSIEDSVDYITGVYEDYLTYSNTRAADLAGKKILEIGPGDNFGVAFLFLCNGASRVVALDRFYSSRDEAQQQRIYQALGQRLSPEIRPRYDALVATRQDGSGVKDGPFSYVHGVGIEHAEAVLEGEKFDAIVSRAVLEHVDSPEASLESMSRLLAPGGRLIHKVDLRDHGLYSLSGMHPLEFLTISDRVYAAMTRRSGRPNRHLVDFYRTKLDALGFQHSIFVTRVLGKPAEILPHREQLRAGIDYDAADIDGLRRMRPKLLERYRGMTDDDLLTAGIFFVAARTAGPPRGPRT